MHETSFFLKWPMAQRSLLFTLLAIMAMPPLLAHPNPLEVTAKEAGTTMFALAGRQHLAAGPDRTIEPERKNTKTPRTMLSDDSAGKSNSGKPEQNGFRWSAELGEDGRLILSGNVPSEGLKNFLYLRAGNHAVDQTLAMEGAPERFAGVAVASIRALKGILSGRIAYEDGSWSFTGLASDENQRRQVIGVLSQNVSLTDWDIDIELPPPFQVCLEAIEEFSLTQTILFAPGSTELTTPSIVAVQDLAETLSNCPSTKIYVEGHTDADGPEDGNMTLSVKRAEAVVEELISAGVSDMRLYAVGYGETLPIASNETRDGKALNRRIVFQLEE